MKIDNISSVKRPLVGIRIPTWATFTQDIYPGILAYMREHERWRLATVVNSTNEIEPTIIDENWEGDGLILFRYTQREARAFKERGVPVVNISSEPPQDRLPENRDLEPVAVPSVVVDNAACGRMAAEHFLRRGFEFFVFWDDPVRYYAKQRGEAFSQALAQVGHDCIWIQESAAKIPEPQRWQELQRFVRRRLGELVAQAGGKPMAIFAKDDICAAGLMNMCVSMGLNMPEQVAVLGCGNDQVFVHTTDPAMSSISYPAHEIGYRAAEKLHEMMLEKRVKASEKYAWRAGEGERTSRNRLAKKLHFKGSEGMKTMIKVPPGRLKARESTGIMAYEDQLVGAALAFIWQESPRRSLSVTDVAEEVAVSGVVLRRRFAEVLSYSPKHEIDRVRLTHLLGYLERTDWSMKKIAIEMDFSSSEEMARFLKRHKSQSPSTYRKTLRD